MPKTSQPMASRILGPLESAWPKATVPKALAIRTAASALAPAV